MPRELQTQHQRACMVLSQALCVESPKAIALLGLPCCSLRHVLLNHLLDCVHNGLYVTAHDG